MMGMRQGWRKRSEEGKGRDEELFRGAGFAGVVTKAQTYM